MILKIGFMLFVYFMPVWAVLIYMICDKFGLFEQIKQEEIQEEVNWHERDAA